MELLKSIYPENEIFVAPLEFNEADRSLILNCNVPPTSGYTVGNLSYITAENYVRILSQSCYVLAEKLIEGNTLALDITIEQFRKAAIEYQLFYRNLAMTFHSLTEKGQSFLMTLSLKDFKEIKRMDDYVLFSFENKRCVISGEMSFIYKGGK